MPVGFSDSIDGNIELLRELIGGLPPESRRTAKQAAVLIENTVNRIKKDAAGNPAAGLGMAFAVLMVAQQMLQSDEEGERGGLIELLS